MNDSDAKMCPRSYKVYPGRRPCTPCAVDIGEHDSIDADTMVENYIIAY